MKVTLNRLNFIQELKDVQRAISSISTLEILTGIKLKLTSSGLILTGSNMNISIELFLATKNPKIQMKIEKEGSIVLHSRFFGDIIRKLPDKTFTIEVLEKNQVSITSGKVLYVIKGLDAKDYPRLPDMDVKNQVKISVDTLKSVINETVFATFKNESRPILTGVHFIIENKELLAVATDGHRLSQRTCVLEEVCQNFDITIPGKSLIDLLKSLTEEKVNILITDNQVLFQTNKMKFYSRILEGKYPDTTRLIPKIFNTEIQFYSSDFLYAIERASLLLNEKRNNMVRLLINANKNQVLLFGNSPEYGKFKESLNFERLTGESIDISFNPNYMKDTLKIFKNTLLKASFIAPNRPFVIKPENSDNFIQLITPIRTL